MTPSGTSRSPHRHLAGPAVALCAIVAATALAAAAPGALATAAPDGFRYGTGGCPPADVAEPVRQFADAPQLCIDPSHTYTARFVTTMGDIVVALDAASQPGTVNNFVVLSRFRYYDGTPIFRAEPRSGLFQGGGQDRSSSPGYTIPDEGQGFTYGPGSLAMSRTAEPDSAGAQWFFATDEQASYLDRYGTFVVFGHVVEGLDVAQAITAIGDANGDPTQDVFVVTVEITESA